VPSGRDLLDSIAEASAAEQETDAGLATFVRNVLPARDPG